MPFNPELTAQEVQDLTDNQMSAMSNLDWIELLKHGLTSLKEVAAGSVEYSDWPELQEACDLADAILSVV